MEHSSRGSVLVFCESSERIVFPGIKGARVPHALSRLSNHSFICDSFPMCIFQVGHRIQQPNYFILYLSSMLLEDMFMTKPNNYSKQHLLSLFCTVMTARAVQAQSPFYFHFYLLWLFIALLTFDSQQSHLSLLCVISFITRLTRSQKLDIILVLLI